MRTLQFNTLLAHCEENPSLTQLRHPLVVLFHIPYMAMLGLMYWIYAESNFGQNLYFLITVCLYLSSAVYHACRPNRLLRIIDQIMISAYVVVTPIPFLYQEPMALWVFAFVMSALIFYKYHETSWKIGTMIFLGLGIISSLLVIFLGLPAIDSSLYSWTGFWLITSISCFIFKLHIYHFEKLKLIPNVWESPESGHFVLSLGVTIYTIIVLANPV